MLRPFSPSRRAAVFVMCVASVPLNSSYTCAWKKECSPLPMLHLVSNIFILSSPMFSVYNTIYVMFYVIVS